MSSANRSSIRHSIGTMSRAALWSVVCAGTATYLFARTEMTPLITSAVLWHVLGGALFGILLLIVLQRRRTGSRYLYFGSAVSLATGLALIAVAAAGVSTNRLPWLFAIHVWGSFCLVAGVLGAGLLRLMVRGRTTPAIASALIMLIAATAVLGATTYEAENYYRRLTATNARQAANSLFPAGLIMPQSGDWRKAADANSCGAPGCHPGIVRQWAASPHAHAAAHVGVATAKSRWCAGCHATSALIEPPAEEESANIATGSVDCLSCHAMAHVPQTTGNAFAVYAPPAVYPFANGKSPAERWLHAFVLRLRPDPHTATLGAFAGKHDPDRTCAACHRLSVNVAQNHYRFLRYDNTWADWQTGPYSQESLHAFQVIPERLGCVDCHMPRGRGGGADHSCPGRPAQASAPQGVRVEIFAVRRQPPDASGPERLDAPLDSGSVIVPAGQTIVVDVLVENHGIGHAFPASTENGDNVWLAFEVRDLSGRTLLASEGDRLGEMSVHRYGQRLLDRGGRAIGAHEKDRMVATAWRRFIGPGEADVAHYRFTVPADVPGAALRLRATLLRRSRPNGAARPDVLAQNAVTLGVRSASGAAAQTATRIDDPLDAPRFYAYGVGLLLQGDNGRARRAFLQAARLAPREPLYLIGAARAYLKEHDLLSARSSLEAALGIKPGMPQALAWLGAVYRESGEYRRALDVVGPLAARYPRDEQLWLEIGLCRLQSGQNAEAAQAFQSALAVDPDDAAAHYNLMQSYLRDRRLSLARREETIFRVLQEDEPLRSILDPYYAAHAGARIESLPIHEHVLRRGGAQ